MLNFLILFVQQHITIICSHPRPLQHTSPQYVGLDVYLTNMPQLQTRSSTSTKKLRSSSVPFVFSFRPLPLGLKLGKTLRMRLAVPIQWIPQPHAKGYILQPSRSGLPWSKAPSCWSWVPVALAASCSKIWSLGRAIHDGRLGLLGWWSVYWYWAIMGSWEGPHKILQSTSFWWWAIGGATPMNHWREDSIWLHDHCCFKKLLVRQKETAR